MNVLDVAQNSVAAGAKLVQITLEADQARGILSLVIEDDGRGMTPEAAQRAVDPFYTTRTTRKVGLGLPFLKMAAEMTGGGLSIQSQPGCGTRVYTVRAAGGEFCADTREMRAVLGGVPLSEPSVAQWIREFIEENTQPILEGVI